MSSRHSRLFRRLLTYSPFYDALVSQSQEYWAESTDSRHRVNSHWDGEGVFSGTDLWNRLGLFHFDLWKEAAKHLDVDHRPSTVVEWGCGGGMNAVHFAAEAERFYGVEISADSLDECGRQLQRREIAGFHPVLIRASEPDGALDAIDRPCDLFLSTYVFELLPTPRYAQTVLECAQELLAAGGVALIQFRYSERSPLPRLRVPRYATRLAQMTRFTIEEFWQAAERIGLTPRYITLVPEQPELSESRYAYCVMTK